MRFFSRCLTTLAIAFAAWGPVATSAQTQPTQYTQTKYPIVLAHGLLGFDRILGSFDYWYQIPQALRQGGATVYVTQQSSANQSELRGEQLLATLKELKAKHGHEKFNLIGHSHGGQTVRYVAGVAPELVASATSIGTPHTGTEFAETLMGVTKATGTTALVATGVNGLTTLIDLLSSGGLPQDSLAALNSLTFEGAAKFNAKFPAGKPTSTTCGTGQGAAGPELVGGVRYFSLSGSSVLTNPLDLLDLALVAGSLSFKGAANDGLVSRCSSRWGTVVRDDFPWNHLDEVNQAFGLRGLMSPNPLSVYRAHANRLKGLGL